MTDAHHDDLGDELRDLPVPEHKAGFWERLDRRLEAEHAVGDAGRGRGPARAPAWSTAARYAPLVLAAAVVLLIVLLVVL